MQFSRALHTQRRVLSFLLSHPRARKHTRNDRGSRWERQLCFTGGGWVGLRPERVILRQLMNGATDGSFVPVIELATALWEEE